MEMRRQTLVDSTSTVGRNIKITLAAGVEVGDGVRVVNAEPTALNVSIGVLYIKPEPKTFCLQAYVLPGVCVYVCVTMYSAYCSWE